MWVSHFRLLARSTDASGGGTGVSAENLRKTSGTRPDCVRSIPSQFVVSHYEIIAFRKTETAGRQSRLPAFMVAGYSHPDIASHLPVAWMQLAHSYVLVWACRSAGRQHTRLIKTNRYWRAQSLHQKDHVLTGFRTSTCDSPLCELSPSNCREPQPWCHRKML
jgi:hypothetical protein